MQHLTISRYILLSVGIGVLYACSSIAVPTAQAAGASGSLVGYWKLDETAGTEVFDSSGNGIHGDHVNSPTITSDVPDTDFTNNRALQFDGTNYVLMDSTLELANYGTGSVTAWFKRDVGSDGMLFANSDNDSSQWFWNMQIRSSGSYATQIRIGHASNRILIETSDTFPAEQWHHVAFTNDGSNYAVYFNGEEVTIQLTEEGTGTEGIWFDDLQDNAEANAIGAMVRSSVGGQFEGSIDDVRIYDRALSAAEVAQLAGGSHPTITWDGSASTDWWNFANWDVSAVPDPYTNILIPLTAKQPRLTASASGSSLILEEGATLDVFGNNFEFVDGGSLKGGGTLILRGHETLENVVNSGTGTVMYNGTGSYSALAAGDAYHTLSINDSLVGYWNMDEGSAGTCVNGADVCDSSGYGNHGTATGALGANNSPQWEVTDKPVLNYANSYAMEFDGEDDVIQVPDVPLLDVEVEEDFSISAWVKTSNNAAEGIVSKFVGATGYIFNKQADGTLRLVIDSGPSGNWNVVSTQTITDGVWHHVSGTISRLNQIAVYVDGQATTNSSPRHSGDLAVSGPFEIGNRTGTAGWDFEGLIDDVRFYKRELTAAEVRYLADGRYPNAAGLATFTLDANLDVSNLTIHSGTLSAGSHTIDVSGNWNNYSGTGSFTAGTSTVDLDGASTQAMHGYTDFYDLEISTAAARTVNFGSGSIQGASNSITLTGADGQLLTLAPLAASMPWYLDVSDDATQDVSYVSVSYSDASPGAGISASDGTSTDGNNNVNWQFTVPTVAFATAAQTAAEAGSTLTATVELSAATTVDVFVPFTVTGTATDGSDYTIATPSPVRIPIGETSTGITITLIDDGDVESDETIILTMGTPEYATQSGTSVHTATVTSEDVASASSSSSAQRAQSGGRRGSSLNIQQRIADAFQYILALFQGRDRGEQVIVDSDGATPDEEIQSPDRPSDTPAIIAERRNRLFAIVDERPVIYADVLADAWYAPYVAYVVEENIAQGYTDAEGNLTGEFGPANPVTRAEILKMALEASDTRIGGGSPRNATAQGSWAGPYIHHAEQEQLSVFAPSADVHQAATRAEVMQTILEVMGIPTGAKIPSPFVDVPNDHPYVRAITIGYVYGFVEGDTSPDGRPLNTFRPDDHMNRAEVAKIIALVKEVLK